MAFPRSFPSLSFAAVTACLASSLACGGGNLVDDPAGTGGAGGIVLTGAGGGTVGGATGGTAVPVDPCLGASDPRLVIAPPRQLLLTGHQYLNMVRALVGNTEAAALHASGLFNFTADVERTFPPADGEQVKSITDDTTMRPFVQLAEHVAQYVFDNFAVLTGCAAPATDTCAKTYLAAFATRAYRKPLYNRENTELLTPYDDARSGGASVETATRAAVSRVLVASPYLYRSELGNSLQPSTTLPGYPLTPYELASALSFFLTDGPPDQLLLDDAAAGTLSAATLGPHVDRLLATPAARVWLTTVIETYFQLNQLPLVISVIDVATYPEVNSYLLADLQTEARMFLDFTMWSSGSKLTDLLTSRTAFLNTGLATNIYKVTPPAGATGTNFVQTTLPADQRSGLLTNAGLLATRARADIASFTQRGRIVATGLLGYGPTAPHPDGFNYPGGPIDQALMMAATQTPQEQAAYRAAIPVCRTCHDGFDPYGLPLDSYDNIGRFRTVGDTGQPVDARATLPPELGGVTVANAIELAQEIARSPRFTNVMGWAMLQYAMVTFQAPVELPDASRATAGCAVADVVTRFQAHSRSRTFPDLVREVALSPAFSLRRPAQ